MIIHLIDGTFELFRAFYGAPMRRGKRGREIGATRALARGMLSLLSRPGVTHVACAFDTVIESFRNRLFPGYKTGEGIEPALLAQFPLAERAVAALGIPVWGMIEFEADDALATAAARFSKNRSVGRVLICSPDKDLTQCVSGSRVVCWDRMRDIVLDEAGVTAKFGVPPSSIPDYLALVGDSADGIPGLPGWGARSASTILAAYRRLERIPADPAKWRVKLRGAETLARTLAAHRKDALLFRRLATLRKDVPLKTPLSALRWRGADKALSRLADELDDPGLVARAESLRASRK